MDFHDFLCSGGQEGEKCEFHKTTLPLVESDHRICINFGPTEDYYRDNPILEVDGITKRCCEPEERFSWFETTLKPNILYAFPYNHPPGVKELMRLDES
jgi:hypothetical protein